ncbi:MAG: tetratricopeptide repeat protein [Spirochaetaceae bacterium]|nr:tetratricopeptide repeat protein [Spirochaetaceae bacterium]
MPSLEALAKFRASFRSIGNEATISVAQRIPLEDMDLPDTEALSLSAEKNPPQDTAQPDQAEPQAKNKFDIHSNEDEDEDNFFDDFSALIPSDPETLNRLEDIPIPEPPEAEAPEAEAPEEPPEQPSEEPPGAQESDELPPDIPGELNIPEADIPGIDDEELPTLEELSNIAKEDPVIDESDIPTFEELSEELAENKNAPESDIPEAEVPKGDSQEPADGELPNEELPDIPELDETELPSLDELPSEDLQEPADGELPNEELPEIPELDETELPSLDELPSEDLQEPADGELPNEELPEIPELDETELPSLDELPSEDIQEPADGELPNEELPEIPELDETELPSLDELPEAEIPELDETGLPPLEELPEADIPELDETGLPPLEELPEADIPEAEVSEADEQDIPDLAIPEPDETLDEQNIPEVDIPEVDSPAAEVPEEVQPDSAPKETPPEAEAERPQAEASEEKPADPPPEEQIFNEDIKIPDIDLPTAGGNASGDGVSLDAFDSFKMDGEDGSEDLSKYALNVTDEFSIFPQHNDIEEIQLSNEELQRLQKTLAGYPLNLRVVCEQIIAEEAVDPSKMSHFVKALVKGASMREAASLASKILDRSISIPKNFEKKTGEALEAEHATFTYFFIHKFIPVFRLFVLVALVAASLFYLIHRFVYTPIYADTIYQKGYDQLLAGDYTKANERFTEALHLHRKKRWFYQYAEAFKNSRQFIFAREKYDLLLLNYPQDKKGVMDYAAMETELSNYKKADTLLWRNILDYKVDDKDALLAVGDNGLAWGDTEPEQYEVARKAYARLLERYGYNPAVLERMMKYFIRTDNLKEVLPLQRYFMGDPKNKVSPNPISNEALAELGGYLLDKKFETAPGVVPNEFVSRIDGIRDVLLRSVELDPALPEPHYHLARYYRHFENPQDERTTLENAVKLFDAAQEESVRRLRMRIDTEQRYAEVLINNREFFPAEDHLKKGIDLYEDALNRKLISRSSQFGKLYANMGDIEYFTKDGNMGTALEYYARAEQNDWAPPEMQYRIGSAYYHQGKWADALKWFVSASSGMPFNRRILNALGNVAYLRGDYDIAQGYYTNLLALLDSDRARFSVLLPHDREDHMELAERLMVVRNNFGVTLEALTERTGNNAYRSQALGLYSESSRTWDVITRDPETMLRLRPGALSGPSINLAYLNGENALHPTSDYERRIYSHIDRDVLEPSPWETLTPQNFRLSDTLF